MCRCIFSNSPTLPSGGLWLHEIKHDGFRIIARKNGAQVRLYSRPGNALTDRFPLIVETLANLRTRSCVIDGEAVICDDNGIASFDRIRYRRHDGKAFLYAFDLIELNGDDLRREPLDVRKATLRSLLVKTGPGLRWNEHIEGDGETIFRHACELGLEGIVSKRKDSPYRSGRSPDWLKMKNPEAPAVKREAEEEWANDQHRSGTARVEHGALGMSDDQYLLSLIHRETVDTAPNSPVRGVILTLRPVLTQWANNNLAALTPSGSFAKGTAIRSGTDIDLFVSLRSDTPNTLKEIYTSLANWMQSAGCTSRKQNVSISVRVGAYDVDLVPAKRHDNYSNDHSLYRRKADTWTKTNVDKHIATVRGGGRLLETRILKLWRNQKRLEFPSFYLELTVIEALRYSRAATLSARVARVLEYLRDSLMSARVVDPANLTGNIISDDLTVTEKYAVKRAAETALSGTWSGFVS
jgi:hypothetical protein